MMSNRTGIPPALLALLEVEDQTAPLWIVGGAVRDLLLQRPSHDYDFSTANEAIALARRVANDLGADIYVLDGERDAARVLYTDQEDQHYTFDFARLRGDSIESDLCERDFTINAMALRISSLEDLVDPCGGLQHLHAGLLELCHESAIENDPIRALRAIRIATELSFHFSPSTVSALGSVRSFDTISAERVRDELFNILSLQDPTTAFQLFRHFNFLPILLPFPDDLRPKMEQQASTHFSERSMRWMATVLHMLSGQPDLDSAAEATLGLMIWTLGRFRIPLKEFLHREITYDRDRRGLIYLISFLQSLYGFPSKSDDNHQTVFQSLIQWLGDHLRLSRDEVEWSLRWAEGLHWLESASEELLRGDVYRYRYFRSFGEAGIGSVLSMLAFELGRQIEPPDQEHWAAQLEIARLILEAWFERYEDIVDPKQLISGEDVLQVLDLKPGPIIGELLEAVREAQVEGRISTREQALAFIKDQPDSKQ